MDPSERLRLTWVLTIRRFVEVAWARNGPARYASVVLLPIAVAATIPGWWWFACALGAAAGIGVDLWAKNRFSQLALELDGLAPHELRRVLGRHVAALSALIAVYCAPYAALSFAPGVGPVIGLLFCAATLVIISALHVMTPTMIFYTIPVAGLGMVANAAALGTGSTSWPLGGLAVVAVLNGVLTARAGAKSFGDLINARLDAELATITLERLVAERTAELVEATRVAEAANTAKSAFLANMSHELRTPLNAVIGYSEIICEDFAAGQTEDCSIHADKIRASALHLLGLIADILDLSKAEADKLILSPQDIDANTLAREALEAIAPLAATNRTAVDLVVEPGVAAMCVDPLRVRQCLMNLLSNAAKFTSDGRIVLHLRRSHFEGVDAVAFAVRDTGVGISADNLVRLFQPFVQADASTIRLFGGAGLGLAITRQLARLMGGDVHAESELGRGSSFTLIVPLAPGALAEAAHARAAA